MASARSAYPGPLTDRQRELAGRYVPLALALARDWRARAGGCLLRDELRGAALLGLTYAARAWRGEFGVRFATYAAGRIKGEMASALRREPRGFEPLPPEPEAVGRVMFAAPDPEPEPGAWAAYEAMLARLTPRQRDVADRLYRLDQTAGQIARDLGLSSKTVRVTHIHIRAALRSP